MARLSEHAPPRGATCLFCAEARGRGAYWVSGGEYTMVCTDCARDGKLGLLVGDAMADGHNRDRVPATLLGALRATESAAWRATALALSQEKTSDGPIF